MQFGMQLSVVSDYEFQYRHVLLVKECSQIAACIHAAYKCYVFVEGTKQIEMLLWRRSTLRVCTA